MAAATTAPLYRIYDLPWATGLEQDRSFRKTVRNALIAVAVLAVLLAVLPVPERVVAEVELPRRLARFALERETPPPPPPPVVEEVVPEPVPEPVVEERVVREPEPVRPPEPVPAPVVEPPPPPVDTVQVARERARTSGLLPFAEQLASLRDNDVTERLDNSQLAAAVGGAAPSAERSLITSRAGTGSGGINTAALSRNTGGGGLSGRETTQVESPVAAPEAAAATRSGTSDKPARSREEIERVFDRNKGAIYALYNRALRENPSLQGKVVLRLTITADGRVTECEIVSSELGDPELEQRLVQRVLLFEFEARDVETITTTKPIDFFPA